MEQRLDRGDWRQIITCLAIAAASLAVGTHYFYQAFPEATIDFRLTREEARLRATSFLDHRGFELAGYHHAAVFDFDEGAKTFLERQLGLRGASELVDHPVRLWRWSHRWFREQEKEEIRVEITTTGDLVGFRHEIPEGAAGARLDPDAARVQAEQFLTHAMGHDLARLEFVEAGTTRRPQRSDHVFTWKLADFRVDAGGRSEATYRYRVMIQGDLVGGYEEYLQVPEAWRDRYEEMRSRNQATSLVALLFLVLTWAAMGVILVRRIRLHDVRWRLVLVFGTITFILTFLAQLNHLPVAIFGFDTTGTFSSFVTEQILRAFVGALLQGVFVAFLTAGAEPVYRQHFGGQISLSEQFLPDGVRTKRFLLGTVIGLTMATLFVAYQVVFYLLAEGLGAWAPTDIPYREMVNTHIPWVVVLLIGWLPAVSEELTSRAFAIPVLHRWLKRRWLAVVLAAVVWGFAHAGYPQQPFWIRGVEVSLAGIAVGYVVLRWGLLPALVWHYTIDALYTALILLRSSNTYYVLSAAVSVGLMLLPLAVAVALYMRHRFFVDPASLLNREDAVAAPPPVPAAPPSRRSPEALLLDTSARQSVYHPLSRRRLLAATAAVGLACTAFLLPRPAALPDPDFAITADEATRAASDWLRRQGVEADTLTAVTFPRSVWDQHAVAYRVDHTDLETALAPYGSDLATATWSVRLFQPGHKEEWTISWLPQDASLYRVQHVLPEEAPGAALTEQEARHLAQRALVEFGIDPSPLEIKEVSSEKLDARRDHWFAWETTEEDPRSVEDSRLRYDVHVAGDAIVDIRRSIKLPEEWLRDRRESTGWRTALRWIPRLAGAAVAVHLLWLFIANLRRGAIQWRRPLCVGGAGAILFLFGLLNGLPTFLADYPTQIPMTMFVIGRIVMMIMATLAVAAAVTAAAGLCASLFPGTLDRLNRAALRAWWPDALALAALATVARLAVARWETWLSGAVPASVTITAPQLPAHLGDAVPALSGLAGAASSALYAPLAPAIAVFYACRVIRRPWLVLVALVVLCGASAGADAYAPLEFLIACGRSLLRVGVFALALACFFRDNLLAYALAAFAATTVQGAGLLLLQSSPALQWQGGMWAAAAAAAVGSLWWWIRAGAGRTGP